MIPKSLLVAYLSLRITEQPSPIARSNVGHVEPFIGLDSAVDVKNVQMPNVNHDVQQPFITQSQDVGVQAQTRYPVSLTIASPFECPQPLNWTIVRLPSQW